MLAGDKNCVGGRLDVDQQGTEGGSARPGPGQWRQAGARAQIAGVRAAAQEKSSCSRAGKSPQFGGPIVSEI
jgi:hypothetical protein